MTKTPLALALLALVATPTPGQVKKAPAKDAGPLVITVPARPAKARAPAKKATRSVARTEPVTRRASRRARPSARPTPRPLPVQRSVPQEDTLTVRAARNGRSVDEQARIEAAAMVAAARADQTRSELHREWLRLRMAERDDRRYERRQDDRRRAHESSQLRDYYEMRRQLQHDRWVERQIARKQHNLTKRNDLHYGGYRGYRGYGYGRQYRARATYRVGTIQRRSATRRRR